MKEDIKTILEGLLALYNPEHKYERKSQLLEGFAEEFSTLKANKVRALKRIYLATRNLSREIVVTRAKHLQQRKDLQAKYLKDLSDMKENQASTLEPLLTKEAKWASLVKNKKMSIRNRYTRAIKEIHDKVDERYNYLLDNKKMADEISKLEKQLDSPDWYSDRERGLLDRMATKETELKEKERLKSIQREQERILALKDDDHVKISDLNLVCPHCVEESTSRCIIREFDVETIRLDEYHYSVGEYLAAMDIFLANSESSADDYHQMCYNRYFNFRVW